MRDVRRLQLTLVVLWGIAVLLILGVPKDLLVRRVVLRARFLDHDSVRVILAGDNMPFGRIQHEYMHLQARRGDLIYDTPYAVATEFCYEAQRPIGLIKPQLRAVRRFMRHYSGTAGRASIESDLSAIAVRASTGDDASTDVQLEAMRVAGIGLAYSGSADGCARLAVSLAQKAHPSLALRASVDTVVFGWLNSSGNQLPYEFAARTWSLLQSSSIQSKEQADQFLGVLLEKAAFNRSRYGPFVDAFLTTLQRFEARDTTAILFLGAALRPIVRSYPDSIVGGFHVVGGRSGLSPAVLSRPDPIIYPLAMPRGPLQIRLNFHGIGQESVLRKAVPNFVARIGVLWARVAGEEVLGPSWRVEVGDWPIQSRIEDGIVAIQWSGLLACEAETYIAYGLPEDAAGATITGAVITLHPGMNVPDVLGQQLWAVAVGQIGIEGRGNDELKMAVNPLPRTTDLLMAPAYQRYSFLVKAIEHTSISLHARTARWVCGIGERILR